MIVVGWDNIDELVRWCVDNIGTIVWTNAISDWIGLGWSISRIQSGFKLRVVDDETLTLAILRWT